MIRYKKAKALDKPKLVEYKLLTILPFVKEEQEKLKIIAFVNDFVREHSQDFVIIYYFFKPIGAYYLDDRKLDTLYIANDYQGKGIGSKVLTRLKGQIDEIKVRKENKEAIRFYQKHGFKKREEKMNMVILKREDDRNENQ